MTSRRGASKKGGSAVVGHKQLFAQEYKRQSVCACA